MVATARSVKAVTFNKLGAFGLVEMVPSIITVLVAYARSASQPAVQLQIEPAQAD
jgi:NADH:ubiquinone oxidoreductase subunit 3 (subunit A)